VIFIGVDPGKTGAVAALEADGRVRLVRPMPLVASNAGRPEYDLDAIKNFLLEWNREQGGAFATVERLQPLPAKVRRKDGSVLELGGTIANFNRGASLGWAWMLCALEIPFVLVSPRRWQAVMLEGTPAYAAGKARAILAAHRLFPGVSLKPTKRARKDSHDVAEALLLAEFGRRVAGREAALSTG
jgi:hypothetical protein